LQAALSQKMSSPSNSPEAARGRGVDASDAGRIVTWRSVAVGAFGVGVIAALAPFNDWVIANTPLIGNFLPVGLLMLLLAFLLFVQAPLRRFAPARAMRRGEVALVLAMWLVGCAVPTSGFMRYVPATLIAIHAQAAENPVDARLVDAAQLPGWLLPTFDKADAASRGRESVVVDYVGRTQGDRQSWLDYARAVPWSRWATPAASWGVFAIGLFGMGLLIPIILQRQWAENERLPFPLATVYLALIEPAEPGRALNSLFRSRLFWLATAAVFGFHLWNGLSTYAPRYFPGLPMGYNLNAMLVDPPLGQIEWYVKRAGLFFSVIGITFFLQSSVSFSLWSFVLMLQLVVMALGAQNAELTSGMRMEHSMGAIFAIAATTIFVGRRHLSMVVRQMFRGSRADEPRGEFISYAAAGWLLLVSGTIVSAWVSAIGLSRPGLTPETAAWSLVAGLLVCGAAATMIIVLYRVVAETGLPFVQLSFSPTRLFVYLQQLAPTSININQASYFHTAWISQDVLLDQRESLAPYAGHALRVLDAAGVPKRRSGVWVVGALVLSLVVAFLVSGAAMLFVEYNFSSVAASTGAAEILNKYAMVDATRGMLGDVKGFFAANGPDVRHGVWLHLAIGAGFTLLLAGGRLRFSWWPLYPIGFLLMYTYAMQMCWFSILIGWVLKVSIVRLGGATALRDLRPLFIGLIVGEACAAGFWLASAAALYALGYEFQVVRLLPT
jgi:uncharacterized membrane protein